MNSRTTPTQAPQRRSLRLEHGFGSLGAPTMRALFVIVLCLVAGRLHARDIEIRPANAAKHGISIKLSSPKPGIVQAVLDFTTMPKEVGLVLQGANEKFIASVPLLPRGHTCIAVLSEDFVQHSYFAFPYIVQPDEDVYRVFLRDKQ